MGEKYLVETCEGFEIEIEIEIGNDDDEDGIV